MDVASLALIAFYAGWFGYARGVKAGEKSERERWDAHIKFAEGYIEAGRKVKSHRAFAGPDVQITQSFDMTIRDVGTFEVTMREKS